MNARSPIPLRPDVSAVARSEARSVRRAVTALALTASRTARIRDPEKYLRLTWPDDALAGRVLKAASAPASTTTSGLPAISPITAFRRLAPASSALRLFEAGLTVDLRRITSVRVPYIPALPAGVGFVGEGAPAPVIDLTFSNVTVGPVKKLMALTAISEELEEASSPDYASDVIGRVVGDAVAKSFDAAAFSAFGGDTITPQGLLNGVTPLAASTATPPINAMFEDVGNLADAIAAADIDINDLVFVAGPKQATAMRMFLGGKFDYPILASRALHGSVAAFAAPAVISAYAELPTVETSKEATLHFASPAAEIVTGAGVVAAGTYSLFQQRLIALRVHAYAAWSIIPGGCAVVNSVTW